MNITNKTNDQANVSFVHKDHEDSKEDQKNQVGKENKIQLDTCISPVNFVLSDFEFSPIVLPSIPSNPKLEQSQQQQQQKQLDLQYNHDIEVNDFFESTTTTTTTTTITPNVSADSIFKDLPDINQFDTKRQTQPDISFDSFEYLFSPQQSQPTLPPINTLLDVLKTSKQQQIADEPVRKKHQQSVVVKSCHICTKPFQNAPVDAVFCTSIERRRCKKAICFSCIHKNKWDPHNLLSIKRQRDTFICAHCKGWCSSLKWSRCFRYKSRKK